MRSEHAVMVSRELTDEALDLFESECREERKRAREGDS